VFFFFFYSCLPLFEVSKYANEGHKHSITTKNAKPEKMALINKFGKMLSPTFKRREKRLNQEANINSSDLFESTNKTNQL